MEETELKPEDVEIVSQEEAFWRNKKEFSEKIVEQLEKDIEEVPRLMEFHKSVAKMCDDKIRELKEGD